MRILALDTASGPIAVAVVDTRGGDPVVRREPAGRGQAERLPGLVAEALAAAGLAPADLDRIVVTTGPGGFTGVRVGVAYARGLALALAVPAIGVTSFAALAASVRAAVGDRPVTVVLDDRRGGVHVQAFSPAGEPAGAWATTTPAAAAAALAPGGVLAGPGAVAVEAAGAAAGAVLADAAVDPVVLARLGAAAVPDGAPEPLYLRPADAIPAAPSRLLAEPRPEAPPRPARPVSEGGEQ